MTETAMTARTQYVEVDGTRIAYREFGKDTGVPLVFLNRYRATIDDWDPLLLDLFAAERRVVLFDSAGIGGSDGQVADTILMTAEIAVGFIRAISDAPVDVLGFSMGGYAALRLVLNHRELVRKLILAGTGAGGGEQPDPSIRQWTAAPEITEVELSNLLFPTNDQGKQAAHAHWLRIHQDRTEPRLPGVTGEAAERQAAAIGGWRNGIGNALGELGQITHDVLIANGDNDIMVPTSNSWVASQKIPNSQLIVYPNAGHGFHYQYPHLFARHANLFLSATWS
jgi:pimeloyl-ACP methyl ester carboxylesterase